MAIDTALVTYDVELEKNRELIRKTIAPQLKQDEFELFMEVCRTVRLNPVIKQIYALSTYDSQTSSNKMSIQTSIDGLRLLAERSGDYAGQIGPEWCGKDGMWKDVWVEDAPPVAARVGVIRKSFQQPLYSVAKFSTYAKRKKGGELMHMWALMPDHMLAKCAESLALRRAFPHETCGLYTREEMGQAMAEDTIEGEITNIREENPTQQAAEKPKEQAKASKPAENTRPVDRQPLQPVPTEKISSNPVVRNLRSRAVQGKLVSNLAEWMGFKLHALGEEVKDVDLTGEQIDILKKEIEKQPVAAGK